MTPPPAQSNYKAMISPTRSSMTALLGSETLFALHLLLFPLLFEFNELSVNWFLISNTDSQDLIQFPDHYYGHRLLQVFLYCLITGKRLVSSNVAMYL